MTAGQPGVATKPPHGDGGEPPAHDFGDPMEFHEAHGEEGEPWLISYADLMTLLFGLFALMFSFAKFDDDKAIVKVDKALAKYFGQNVLSPTDAHSKKDPNQSPDTKGDDKLQDPGNYTGLADQMKVELDKAKAAKDVTFKQAPDGYEINFVSSLLFASGKAELTPEGGELVSKLGMLIKNTGIKYQVRVEGHTDDNPIHSGIFPSNWELSAARAADILRIFEGLGFDPPQLTAVGYGSSRPAYPEPQRRGKTDSGEPAPESARGHQGARPGRRRPACRKARERGHRPDGGKARGGEVSRRSVSGRGVGGRRGRGFLRLVERRFWRDDRGGLELDRGGVLTRGMHEPARRHDVRDREQRPVMAQNVARVNRVATGGDDARRRVEPKDVLEPLAVDLARGRLGSVPRDLAVVLLDVFLFAGAFLDRGDPRVLAELEGLLLKLGRAGLQKVIADGFVVPARDLHLNTACAWLSGWDLGVGRGGDRDGQEDQEGSDGG